MKWIRTKEKLPDHSKDVEVIILINDINPKEGVLVQQRRLISIGFFESSLGWHVRNGYLKWRSSYEPNNSQEYKKWEYVSHWREMGDETKEILGKWGWDKEDFK